MDDTGFLHEGQVYVSFDTMQGRYHEPECQKVVITRSPALHPGDIQLAHHVIPPEGHPLLELRNCVVFSQRGDRDLPSMLSGGDLDGDIYNIIWDEAIVSQVRSFSPADYPRLPIVELGKKVEAADMINFFVDFISQDCLGVIATRHMILADLAPQGTRDSDCVKLAELHSQAVDFSKTGRAVNLRELPKTPRQGRPHLCVHHQNCLDVCLHEQVVLTCISVLPQGPKCSSKKKQMLSCLMNREVMRMMTTTRPIRMGRVIAITAVTRS